MELTDLTLAEAATLVAARQLSPRDLVDAHLERIDRLDGALKSYITVAAAQARRQAAAAAEDLKQGLYRGTLHGLPLAYKDLFETAGLRTTGGSPLLAANEPERDAEAIRRLMRQGAITLGKLNLHEWAISITTDNPTYGTCRNPWNQEYSPGGSSGGSGAALAAGLCLGALGTDTAGSIRLPAAFCGVVGLRPTFGRISRRGALPLSPQFDSVGPMARTVRDVAILLQAMAGYDRSDPYSEDLPPDPYTSVIEGPLDGLRIGLSLENFHSRTRSGDPEVLAAVEEAGRQFERLGARLVPTPIQGAREATRALLTLVLADGAAVHESHLLHQPEQLGQDVRAALRRGQATSAIEMARAMDQRVRWCRQVARLFEGVDLLLTPAAPTTAPPIQEPERAADARPPLLAYLAPWSLAGVPALALPCGFSQAGLPIGMQLVGPPWSEARLLTAGHAYEQAHDWVRRRPVMASETTGEPE